MALPLLLVGDDDPQDQVHDLGGAHEREDNEEDPEQGQVDAKRWLNPAQTRAIIFPVAVGRVCRPWGTSYAA